MFFDINMFLLNHLEIEIFCIDVMRIASRMDNQIQFFLLENTNKINREHFLISQNAGATKTSSRDSQINLSATKVEPRPSIVERIMPEVRIQNCSRFCFGMIRASRRCRVRRASHVSVRRANARET